MSDSKCAWTEDEDGDWLTDCGQTFMFNDGGPNDNHFKHCPYCGEPVIEEARDEGDDDD